MEYQEQLAELLKESRKAQREDRELAESMQVLLASKHFQLYLSRVIGSRLEEYGKLMLEPSGGMDGLVRSEFVKGAMYAFCLARDLPQIIIASMSDSRTTQEPPDG